MDIDLNLKLDDIIEDIKLIENILNKYGQKKITKITKLNSVYLFKYLYNLECENRFVNKRIK